LGSAESTKDFEAFQLPFFFGGDTVSEKKLFFNEKEVAAMLGRSVGSLRADRLKKQGLPFYKLQGMVRYRLKDVADFIEQGRRPVEKPMDGANQQP
jgi:hypothetical protein